MFEVFKTVKIALKNLNKGKCKQYENEEFEAFEKVFIFLLHIFSNR